MKELIRISVIQMESHQSVYEPTLKENNVQKVLRHLVKESLNSQLIVFPELVIGGYIPLRGYVPELKSNYWEISEDAKGSQVLGNISEVVDKTECVCVIGFSEKSVKKYELFNSAAIFESRKPTRFVRKTHIPTEENHYFTPGSRIDVFDTFIGKIGVAICYDQLFPELIRVMALQGAEIVIMISAVLDSANFRIMSEAVPIARAIENQVHVIFCNGCGPLKSGKQNIGMFGDSKIINSFGEVVSRAENADECVLRGSISEEELRRGSSYLSIFRERQPHLYGKLVEPLKGTSD